MKILMTGGTRQHVGAERRRRIEVWDTSSLMKQILQSQGHEIDHRVVQPGDDLSRYDLFWLYSSSVNSIVDSYGLGLLWAMFVAGVSEIPTVLFFEDWQIRTNVSSFKSFETQGIKQVTKALPKSKTDPSLGSNPIYHTDPALALKYADNVIAGAAMFNHPDSSLWRVMTPTFIVFDAWGDRSIITDRMPKKDCQAAFVDPTPMVIEKLGLDLSAPVPPFAEKQRRWSMASLQNQMWWIDKQNLTWPVDYVGLKGGPTLRTEPEVLKNYESYWGVLSTEYNISGSGWYRSRFLFSALAGCVLYGGPKDGACLGPYFTVPTSEIEELEDGDLEFLALGQRKRIFDTIVTDPQVTYRQVQELVEKVTG